MTLKTLLLIPLACLTLTACGGVDPNSPLGQRQALFKQMLKTSESLGGMLRGRVPFDEGRFVEGSLKLEQLSRQPWQHFPQVKEEDQTRAKDEVWQRQTQFQQLAHSLEESTAALVSATSRKPLTPEALAPAMQQVEDACEACHTEFRAF